MQNLIDRWTRAGIRAQEERVRILELGGQFYATSTSQPLGSYALRETPAGWSCECPANRTHELPCKHLWALADTLGLDLLSDIRVSAEFLGEASLHAA